MMSALWFGARFLKTNRAGNLFWGTVFAGLTVYANFTQILFFIPFVGLLLFNTWQEKNSVAGFWQKTWPALLMTGVWTALLITPLRQVSAHSEVQNWNRLNTLFESAKKSMEAAIHRDPLFGHSASHFLSYFAILFTIGIGYVAVRQWLTNGKRMAHDFRIFLVLLLVGVLCTNVFQVEATHTPYLQPRLALLYWPLFALSLGIAATWLYERSAKWAGRLMIPLSFVALVNTAVSVNLREATEWWHDRDTYVVLEYLRNLQKAEGHPEPYTFDTYDSMQNSFIFHTNLDPRGYNNIIQLAEWHPNRPPTKEHEFYYAISEGDAAPIMDDYEVVLKLPKSDRVLVRRKKITPN